ncbi:MAG: hypothetical protein E6I75_28255 [Chloroflexi bacterium]|nr:MAG: hypothetical protein E6I75_28255 [Chloroflexota bacterium]
MRHLELLLRKWTADYIDLHRSTQLGSGQHRVPFRWPRKRRPMRWLHAFLQLLVCLCAAACLPADRGAPPPAPTSALPPPVPAAGQGYPSPRQVQPAVPQALPTQPTAGPPPPAAIDGRLLIATTRISSRPRSDLPPDYRLAWWSSAGLQPIHLPDDDRGVVDAAARPGGGAIAAIVGGVSLVRADGSGGSPVDLLPRLAGPQPAGLDRLLVRQTPPVGISFVDPSGQARSQTGLIGLNPTMSPDGQRLALGYAGAAGYYSIYVAEPPFAEVHKLTPDEVLESAPAWSPDAAWVAYVGQAPAGPSSSPGWVVRIVRSDGTNEQTVIPNRPGISYSSLRWSPDGRRIAFTRYEEAPHTRQIGIVNRDGSDLTMLSDGAANDRVLDWAP